MLILTQNHVLSILILSQNVPSFIYNYLSFYQPKKREGGDLGKHLWHWIELWNICSDLPLDPLGSAAQLKLHLAGMKDLIWRWEQFPTQAQGGGRQDEKNPKEGGRNYFQMEVFC